MSLTIFLKFGADGGLSIEIPQRRIGQKTKN